MATINFPTSPANGATYDFQGVRYTWVQTGGTGFWKVVTPGTFGAATAAEINTGTDTTKYVTPQALADSKQVTELSTGATELDYNSVKKLATQNDGVAVIGKIYADNHVDGITATAAEINVLDGATASTAEINKLDGLTATTAELNKMDGVTATAAELNSVDGLTATTAELNKIDGFTGTVADLNYAAELRATGVTDTEFNKLDGFTGTVADLNYAKDLRATGVTTTEFNKLDGLTSSVTELNRVDGVTSNVQTQLNAKAATAGTTGTKFYVADAGTSTNVAITSHDYSTSTFAGTVKMRVSGSNLYISTTSTNP